MRDLLDWWFTWGAIVFLVVSLFITALVVFDSVARKINATAWLIGVVLVPVLVLPSLIFKTQLDKPVPLGAANTIEGTAEFFFWIGVLAGIAQVVLAIGYFMLAGLKQQQVRPVVPGGGWPPVYPPNQYGGGGGGGPKNDPNVTRGAGGASIPNRPPKVPNAMLIERNGGRPVQHPVYRDRTTIGREESNLVLIDQPDVSRWHAVIQEHGDRFSILDVGSSHGTFVNGGKIRTETYLQDDDEIKLGPAVALVFKSW